MFSGHQDYTGPRDNSNSQHSSGKQPTSSVGVSLVVGQQGRGEAGVGGVVRDPVLGVEEALGVGGVDEGRRAAVDDPLGGGDLEGAL